ncbi:MAG: hypothetical protein HY465_01710, partial [Deltaproteobacteria bacterium]|nr:hypothetical protein [Deltaproteobacteria bacterium]
MAAFAPERFSQFVFDFDGVLFDSARECFVLAARAASGPDWKDKFSSADFRGLEYAFLKSRYHVGPPWQFALLLKLLLENRVPQRTEDFLLIAERERGIWESFTEAYFAERKELSKNPTEWLNSFGMHKGPLEFFRSAMERGQARVLSTRNEESILRLLRELARIPVKDEILFPRAGAKEKWELLLEHCGDLDPAQVLFLDDYVAHLLPALDRGFGAHLAAWGYLSPFDKEIAARKGLPVLE